MKRFLLLVGISILLLTGCDKKKNENVEEKIENQKTMTCTRTASQGGMKLDLNYEVKYTGTYVDTVKTVEKITFDNTAVIETYKETIEEAYSPYKEIEYYDNDITVDGNTLISTVNIDYTKIDTKKLIDIDSGVELYIKDGKVSVNDLESLYNSIGATCKKD